MKTANKPVQVLQNVFPKKIDGYDRYVLFENDMWFDGVGWSSNDMTQMNSFRIFISENATTGELIKALKKAGVLKPYQRWTVNWSDELYIYIDNYSTSILWTLRKETML